MPWPSHRPWLFQDENSVLSKGCYQKLRNLEHRLHFRRYSFWSTYFKTVYGCYPSAVCGKVCKITLYRSIGLWRWYINISITILDIILRPVFYLKHDVLETGFCLRLQVEPTQLGLRDRASLYPSTGDSTLIEYVWEECMKDSFTQEKSYNGKLVELRNEVVN
jgi:hypothetical protein